jgi:DNA-binding transcriptional ArsR family regulator
MPDRVRSEHMDGDPIEEHDPADAFGALSDPTRVAILRALWEADDQTGTFSDLRERVGMADSGQFNYHLDKLSGRFVRKTENGYELALAGRHVVGSLLKGAYASTEPIDPIPLEEPCPFCGGDRTFHYEDEQVTLDCAGCSAEAYFDVPPGVFSGYDRSEFPLLARRYLRVLLHEASNGFCPYCEGKFRPTVETDHGEDNESVLDPLPMARYECDRCGEEMFTDLGTALLFEPPVAGFYADHDVDIRDKPLAEFITTGDDVTVRHDDPLRIAVIYTSGDERLELLVDEGLTVEAHERK